MHCATIMRVSLDRDACYLEGGVHVTSVAEILEARWNPLACFQNVLWCKIFNKYCRLGRWLGNACAGANEGNLTAVDRCVLRDLDDTYHMTLGQSNTTQICVILKHAWPCLFRHDLLSLHRDTCSSCSRLDDDSRRTYL